MTQSESLRICWCDSGLCGWSSAGSPQGDLRWLQTPNNHPHPLVWARGFHLSSKIFLLRWKTKVRGRHLRPNFDEKQGKKSQISKGENYFLNLENREEKEKLFYKILKIERRKRNCSIKSWKSRGEREVQYKNLVNREEKEKCFL